MSDELLHKKSRILFDLNQFNGQMVVDL